MIAPTEKMHLRTCTVGSWQMNSYLLVCSQTRASVLIDPGAEATTLRQLVDGTMPVAILLTHTHNDHIGALEDMRTILKVPVMAHPGPRSRGGHPNADRWLIHGDVVRIGAHTLHVYHTPGHSEDMLCFGIEDDPRMIVGDTIFMGGPGRTWSASDFQTTLETLRNHVLPWPDDTICYPGHGNAFRLGDLRPAIEAFVARNHGDFFGDASWENERAR